MEKIYTPNKFPLQQEQQQYARLLFAQRQGMVCQYGKNVLTVFSPAVRLIVRDVGKYLSANKKIIFFLVVMLDCLLAIKI
ncbi:hypothetical protein ACO1EU_001917 [Neisseria gonorrhoeae]